MGGLAWPCRFSFESGNSFHVFDQGQFAKEVLPKYFKHNNMASFVRQLNMYGFRKVVHIEQGGLVKPEKDDTEFQHPYFIRGQEHLLENIKRKVTSVSSIKNEDIKVRQDNVTKLLTDIQVMKGKQESMDSKLIAMKQYHSFEEDVFRDLPRHGGEADSGRDFAPPVPVLGSVHSRGVGREAASEDRGKEVVEYLSLLLVHRYQFASRVHRGDCELHQCMITAAQAASNLDVTDYLTCVGDQQVRYRIPSGRAVYYLA
ncbi:hypothetical protein QYF61_000430 [Mycteria americana]|uniref:HSF-type DNA-binding domain-containing protein n=1 Tax=Mycteria americana TaxID=33587 RepID=A0AAN7MHI5_MYCAM|nr:hypothetical protein QYF61_000430 [Mycteria americana]